MSQEVENPLHIGNLVGILSDAYGYTVGRVIYRDIAMVRIMPQEVSDRAIDFPMTADGSSFTPELGVSMVEIIEYQPSDYYVDFLGSRPGDTLEFFTGDGQEAAPTGVVDEVIKSASKDSIKLTDGRIIKFRGIGPPAPIIVVRVHTDAAADAGAGAADAGAGAGAGDAGADERQVDILALLSGVLPTATVEVVPTAERSYPDSMQREDLFQDLLSAISAKQRTNLRRIHAVEREVDLAVALKNKSVMRDDAGRITGTAPYLITTVADAVNASSAALPAAIPIVSAARVINIDEASGQYKESDVVPRSLDLIENESEQLACRYLDGAFPEALGRGFYAYTHDLLSRGQSVLQGPTPVEWREDQDVIRTAGPDTHVQGLSAGLPGQNDKDAPPVSLAFVLTNIQDRSVRVLRPDKHTNLKTGETYVSAPSDPSKISGYIVLPPKAALRLRPPKRSGDLPMALLYSAALESDNLPTIAQTLHDVYSRDADSPQNAWILKSEAATTTEIAGWLESVLQYAVHPIDSMGPRSPQLLSMLDTLGLGTMDLAPAVADIIWSWTKKSQSTWRSLLVERRKAIQAALDTEEARTFQSVTDSPSTALWATLREAAPLKELLEDIQRRNPTIVGAPTLLTASLLTEAQGDAMPLVWAEIAKLDTRAYEGDSAAAATALAASRAYILKRKALRDAHLLSLTATPEVSTCPHAVRLEAVRNVRDVLQRSRLLRDFIEEFQGPKSGEWMSCVLCKANCVCYHELMELEALAQPARMDAIQKQILIKYGGDRYEGKIVCRNCGQALQDIDYDEHVEFDDQGRPKIGASVLTDEQLAEPTDKPWIKSDLAPPVVTFATQNQRDLGDALQTIIERGGLQVPPDVMRQIVRHADLYVSLRAPPAELYEKQRSRMLTAASTKIKTATGVGGATADVPTYAAVLDQLRVSALTALTAIALQSSDPSIVVNNPFPLCKLSRGGYPFDPKAKPEEDGALLYMACIVASIQRDSVPWRSLTWAGETKLETRRKKVLTVALAATQIILGADPKSAPLSFTPEIRSALSKAQTDVVAIKAKALVSLSDELPNGFRPDPFPPKLSRPSVERDPLPAITAALASAEGSVKAMVQPVANAMRQQAIAIIDELHEVATAAVASASASGAKPGLDAVCCPVAFSLAGGILQGEPEQLQLLKARSLLRGSIPTAVNAGTHLWAVQEIPVPVHIEQVVEEGVFFKLFLKYCYRGAQVGSPHEFSVGNMCRQCGLSLGKPIDLIDFGKEGATILAAQQGDLRIEVTNIAFNALSEAVRRRKIILPVALLGRESWMSGLAAVISNGDDRLRTIVASIAGEGQEGSLDEIGRATLWTPLTMYMDELRTEVGLRIGPLEATSVGRMAVARAREATTAFAMFDTLTEDPFIEGPRALQEYWCAKVQAAGSAYTVTTVTGAVWASLSRKHNDLMNTMVSKNSMWFGGDVTDTMRPVLRQIALAIGPRLHAWIGHVRPAPGSTVWTIAEARTLLRTIVLEAWRDALTTTSPMYATIASPTERETAAAGIADWTRALMFHVKQQYVRFSKETIKRILQDRAGLERDTIVEEFQSIKDDDQRAAELMKKQFGIGRWGQGANLQKYSADTFEFESEQRKRMGIVDAPVDPILLEGAAQAAQPNDFGFGALEAAPEDGYDVGQGADGDDY